MLITKLLPFKNATIDALLVEPGSFEGKDNLYLPNHWEKILTMWKCKYSVLERLIRDMLNIYLVLSLFKKITNKTSLVGSSFSNRRWARKKWEKGVMFFPPTKIYFATHIVMKSVLFHFWLWNLWHNYFILPRYW